MMKRLDNIFAGLVLGIICPIIGVYLYYTFTYRSQTSFSGFIDLFKSFHLFVAYISLACYISNLPLFFLFIWKEKYKGARGVLFATIAYTAWVIYQKYL